MITPRYLKGTGHIRVLPGFHTLDPGALNAERYLVLALTRCGAGMTPDTSIVVDQKTVIHADANSIWKKPYRVLRKRDRSVIRSPDLVDARAYGDQNRISCNDRLLHLGQKVQIIRPIYVDQFTIRNVHDSDLGSFHHPEHTALAGVQKGFQSGKDRWLPDRTKRLHAT